ncbi:MAG: leucine-rich repeat domain-containing protein [Clostridiales bacterium]|nr:leucine-rich repeat domain-containing protein [Clostridiales bacterium]
MNKKLVIFLTLCMALGFVFGAIGCSEPEKEHVHNFVEEITTSEYLKNKATCTTKATYYYSCACGAKSADFFEYGKAQSHSYTYYINNGDETHIAICAHDSSHAVTQKCSGGTPTVNNRPVCSGCRQEYGSLLCTDGLKFTLINNGTEYEVSGYTGSSNKVYIPTRYDDIPVTSIGYCAFYNCTRVTSITLPNSIKTINDGAFANCHSLKNVLIPDGVTSIGNGAFYYCSSLEEITLPNNVITLGNGAFYYCSMLESIVIPTSVQSIGSHAFYSCYLLANVELPDTLTTIGSSTFSYCISLKDIKLPDSLNAIANTMFYGCDTLETVTLGNNVASIGAGAFYCCESLKAIDIPASVTSIEESAFAWCSSITTIEIPVGVLSIGDSAFDSCGALETVLIPNTVTTIGEYAFYGCSSLQTINCEIDSAPIDWDSAWNLKDEYGNYHNIVWEYKA